MRPRFTGLPLARSLTYLHPVPQQSTHEKFMRAALLQAKKGLGTTTPNPAVGAVLVLRNRIIACGHHRFAGGDHAEIDCLRKLDDPIPAEAVLYVTLEPCDMCVGAMFHARIARVVYGATDPKKQILKNNVKIEGGVLAAECGQILSAFFAAKR